MQQAFSRTNIIFNKESKLTWLNILSNKTIIRILTAIWLTFTANTVFFSHLDNFAQIPSAIMLLMLNLVVVVVLTPGFLFKPMIVLLLLVSASTNYFSQHFGIMIDSSMLQNMFETNIDEASDLITLAFFKHLMVFAFLPCFLLLMTKQKTISPLVKRAATYVITLLLSITMLVGYALTQYQSLSGYYRMHKELRYYVTPINSISSLKSYIKSQLHNEQSPFVQIADRVEFQPFSNKPTVFILVLGETVRADHFSLNGYSRQTNPQLTQLALINFNQVTSCGTATAHSVPCMFSWMNHNNYDEFQAKHSENVIDIIARAGFEVVWLENDGGCKGVCNRVKTVNVAEQAHCIDGCPDKLLFSSMKALTNTTQNRLIVLHQQGSHGPAYFRRSQPEHKSFLPECQDETFASCSAQEIVNAYDNSLVETDALVAQLIKQVEQQKEVNAGVLYVADHGESLGENGVFLHGLPYAFAPTEQTHVPMFLWFSKSYQKDANFNVNCLTKIASLPTSHDALFGSLLGLLSIDIQTQKPLTNDIAQCRRKHAV